MSAPEFKPLPGEKARFLNAHSCSPYACRVEIEGDKNWLQKSFSGFRQDTSGFILNEDEPNEMFVPPSFAWYARITGARRHHIPEGELGWYYVNLRIPGREGEPLNDSLADSYLQNGMFSLDTYASCGCTLKVACKNHGGHA